MRYSRVARRYAKALFESALEKKQLNAIAGDFLMLGNHCRDLPSLSKMLASPVVPRSEKLASLEKAYKSRLQPMSMVFIRLLMQKGRESYLAAIADEFQHRVDGHNGVVRGDVVSVFPLSKDQREILLKTMSKLTGKKVLLNERVEEDVLGGVVVRIGDMVYDASLRHQLVKLRENLTQS